MPALGKRGEAIGERMSRKGLKGSMMMGRYNTMLIQFKGKVRTVYNLDDTVAWQYVAVPKAFTSAHWDKNEWRKSRKFGPYANSDLFPSMVKRAVKALGVGDAIRLDRVPEGVLVDTSGFLAVASITIGDA